MIRAAWFLLTLLVVACGLVGCAAGPDSGAAPAALPDSVASGEQLTTRADQIKIQVGHFLNDDLATRHFTGSLRDEGILGVYLKITNGSPVELRVGGQDCRLYGKAGEEYFEIPRLPMREVAEEYFQSTVYERYFSIPLGILLMVWPPSGIGIISAGQEELDRKDGENEVLFQHFKALSWTERTLAPEASAKGVLCFDWTQAERYPGELYLAVDLRDVASEWRLILPVKLRAP